MRHEYYEGPEALKKFNTLATKLFRAPKSTTKQPAKPVRKLKPKPGKD